MERDQMSGERTQDDLSVESSVDPGVLQGRVEELQTRLHQAQQGTHAFVAMLAHELRTPLGAILMWAHVLRMGRESDREAAVDAIEISARAQSKLIGSLLDVTRAVAGRLRIERRPVDLSAVTRSVAEQFLASATIAKTRLDIHVAAAAGPWSVVGDALRLREMVTTLLANALHVSSEGGAVELVLSRTANTVRLTVSDSGPSLSPDELASLFIPFRIAGEPEQRPPGTLGVELPLVRLLAELHGGSVAAHPAPGGEGTVVTLDIPPAEDLPDQKIDE